MFSAILSWLGSGINFAYGVFTQFISSSPGLMALFISMFLIYTVVRMIIMPIIGSTLRAGASDYVKKQRNSGG